MLRMFFIRDFHLQCQMMHNKKNLLDEKYAKNTKFPISSFISNYFKLSCVFSKRNRFLISCFLVAESTNKDFWPFSSAFVQIFLSIFGQR